MLLRNILLTIPAITLATSLYAQALPTSPVTDIRTGKQTPFNQTVAKGKVTLITFWATWCLPGKREVKTISSNLSNWKKQVDFNFITIAVDQQNTEHLARAYIQKQKWNFPCYVDAISTLKPPLKIQALPCTIIIDKAGKIVYSHTGYETPENIYSKLKQAANAK